MVEVNEVRTVVVGSPEQFSVTITAPTGRKLREADIVVGIMGALKNFCEEYEIDLEELFSNIDVKHEREFAMKDGVMKTGIAKGN